MKKTLLIIALSLLFALSAHAQNNDVSIDSDGNVITGASAGANLEVTGASAEMAINGIAFDSGGTGVSGAHYTGAVLDSAGYLGNNATGVYGYGQDWAGYFQGNVRIENDLTVDGSIINPGLDTAYVNVTGDTLTGNLTVNSTFINTTGEYRIDGTGVLNAKSTNTLLGKSAGISLTTAIDNTFLGMNAGSNTTSGGGNTFTGFRAGFMNSTGEKNAFYGYQAGYTNSIESSNTYIGYNAGYASTGVYGNTYVGESAGYSSVGSMSTFIGYQAGKNDAPSATQNTFLGYNSGLNNGGISNTFVGWHTGYSNTGSFNVFMGDSSGMANTTGASNAFYGKDAGYANTSGSFNSFFGTGSGAGNTQGAKNTYIGVGAGSSNSLGNSNTSVGHWTGLSNTGNQNTFMGESAGYSNVSGSGNLFLGFEAGYNETGSNKLYIANGRNNSDVLIAGDFSTGNIGIGTTTPAATLELYKYGGQAFKVTSRMLTAGEAAAYVTNDGSGGTGLRAESYESSIGVHYSIPFSGLEGIASTYSGSLAVGVFGQAYGMTSNRGIWAVVDNGTDNIAVYGENKKAMDDSPAIYGINVVTDFYGVGVKGEGLYKGTVGVVNATGTQAYYGVTGSADTSGGGGTTYGVHGTASGGSTNYGIYGSAYGGTLNYAGYFNGDVEVTGYTKLALTTGAPPATDCDAPVEYGRMKVDSSAGILYVCMASGWVPK